MNHEYPKIEIKDWKIIDDKRECKKILDLELPEGSQCKMMTVIDNNCLAAIFNIPGEDTERLYIFNLNTRQCTLVKWK